MKVHVLESAKWPPGSDELQDQVKVTVEKAHSDAKNLLATIPAVTNIVVEPGSWGTSELMIVGGYTHNPEHVYLNFDSSLPYGKKRLLTDLRGAVFHELNHAAYFAAISPEKDLSLVEDAIFEGLATVFERDYSGGSKPAFSNYENDVVMREWLSEITDLGEAKDKLNNYKLIHPDGRRWISYKTGTWIVDRAIAKSGKSVINLSQIALLETLALAQVG